MGTPLNVLLVEDSEDDALLIVQTLKSGGYHNLHHKRVFTAQDFIQALQQETWDIILSDYSMPDFSGLAAFNLYKESGLDIPFLIVSGAIGEETAVMAMKAGVHDYLLKDNLNRLIPAIERELQETQERAARRKAEKALKETKERYRLLVNAIKDYAICMLDHEGHVQTWNKGAEHVNGYTQEEVLGKNFSCFFAEQEQSRYYLTNAVQHGQFQDEGWMVRKNGQKFWASFLLTPIYNDEDELVGFSKITRDMSELKEAEQQIQKSMMTTFARGQSLVNISHELRTPLHTIISGASVMLDGMLGPLNEKQMEYILMICKSGEHMLQLIGDLLDLAKMDAGKLVLNKQVITLSEFINDMVGMMEPLFQEKEQKLELKLKEPLPTTFQADPLRLKQVICNLLSNSHKFTPREKTITICCALNPPQELVISVQDEGPGIPDSELEMILEPFGQGSQTNLSSIKGSGLGLSLTKRLIELHQGRLEIKSTIGKGSEFTVVLPVVS